MILPLLLVYTGNILVLEFRGSFFSLMYFEKPLSSGNEQLKEYLPFVNYF